MLAAWHYHRLPREKSGSAEVATWTYVGISLLGPLVAGALQLSLITVMFKVLFGAREGDYMRELQRVTLEDVPTAIIEARKQMAWTPNYFAALAMFSYLGAGAVWSARFVMDAVIVDCYFLLFRKTFKHLIYKKMKASLIYTAICGISWLTLSAGLELRILWGVCLFTALGIFAYRRRTLLKFVG